MRATSDLLGARAHKITELIDALLDRSTLRHTARLAAPVDEWAARNPGPENDPDYWRAFKRYAIEQLGRSFRIVQEDQGTAKLP